MAVRLNVIVLRPTGEHRHFDPACDDAVGQLLGRPGLDLVLLDRIPGPNESGTERLAVESVAGDVACVAWTDAEQVSKPLGLLGKRVARVPHRRDVEAAPVQDAEPIAKLYHFDMRREGASQTILADLQALLATRQTPTFQIGAGGSAKPMRASAPAAPKAQSKVAPIQNMTPSPAKPSAAVVSPPPLTPNQATDLDALVDQLDELDL
ncbi:hypothetical protein RISK_002944 [Rhodopirellula islandica]|uniref:Uncharacterized protein n=1 Tax=Rhodopirellula islandica TaxID=595434 RepID=A0A0J1BF27_RHOIS|nr:hypothetical protein [Rhodopirellula islandica]KLU05182.1 hypothetical protein RISK_002944 [Rhodopirellula islandica]